MSAGEDIVELAVAGVVAIVLGSALAPLLPFNVTILGWFLIFLAIVMVAVTIIAGVVQLVEAL